MSYLDDIRSVAQSSGEEIARDLAQARQDRQRGERGLDALMVREAALRWLSDLARRDSPPAATRTLHEAMATVLKSAPGQMLRAADLAAEIDRRGLYRMRDGRAVEAQQIHARVGNYPEKFQRESPFIKLT